jgi:hypothetical protein
MTIDFDTQVHLADLRLRVLNGDPITPEEYRDLFLELRRGRDMAAAATKAAAAKARKASVPASPNSTSTNCSRE